MGFGLAFCFVGFPWLPFPPLWWGRSQWGYCFLSSHAIYFSERNVSLVFLFETWPINWTQFRTTELAVYPAVSSATEGPTKIGILPCRPIFLPGERPRRGCCMVLLNSFPRIERCCLQRICSRMLPIIQIHYKGYHSFTAPISYAGPSKFPHGPKHSPWHAQSFIFSWVKFRWFRWFFCPALHPGLRSDFFRRFLSKDLEKVSAGVYNGCCCCLPNSLSVDLAFSVWYDVFGIGRPSVVWDCSASDFFLFARGGGGFHYQPPERHWSICQTFPSCEPANTMT